MFDEKSREGVSDREKYSTIFLNFESWKNLTLYKF